MQYLRSCTTQQTIRRYRADKKKVDYQEGLEQSRADSGARNHDSYMKDPEKSCAQSRERYMKDPENSRADSAARSRESYKKGL